DLNVNIFNEQSIYPRNRQFEYFRLTGCLERRSFKSVAAGETHRIGYYHQRSRIKIDFFGALFVTGGEFRRSASDCSSLCASRSFAPTGKPLTIESIFSTGGITGRARRKDCTGRRIRNHSLIFSVTTPANMRSCGLWTRPLGKKKRGCIRGSQWTGGPYSLT